VAGGVLRPETRAALRARGIRIGSAADGATELHAGLVAELEALDWELLDRQRAALNAAPPAPPVGLGAPPLLPPATVSAPDRAGAAELGWRALREGRVAVATVAGGQASRLGFDGPKGAYPLGAVSGASLFQMLAGQVARLRERGARPLPWIVQTGPDNHAATAAYLRERAHYGLGAASVRLVCQGTLPALTVEGQLLLAEPGRLFRNPDGHGGFFRALVRSGAAARLRAEGIDTLFYSQIDNPLVRVADPVFLGRHLAAGAAMSVKVVEKTDPREKVGLVVVAGGKPQCIEYSDLDPALASARADDGGLLLRAGNIAVHVLDLDFAEAMATADLPLHAARKLVRALPDAGGLDPVEREAVKFETFVFDALPRAGVVVVQLAERAEEFAPVKNRTGADSIDSCRAALDAQGRRWLEGLAPRFVPGPGAFEIQSGIALDAADLATRVDALELRAHGRLLTLRRSR